MKIPSRTQRQQADIALLEGDCLELLGHIRSASVDLVLSDPPYGLSGQPFDFPVDWPFWWSEINRIARPQAIIALFAQQPFSTEVICSNRGAFHYELVWEMSNPKGSFNGKRRPLNAHQQILVFCREPRKSCYNPQREYTLERTYRKRGGTSAHYGRHRCESHSADNIRHPRSVLHFSSIAPDDYLHPNQKPLALIEYLVRSYSEPGALVVDPFSGSGTTAVACRNTGRRCIAIERASKFVALARRRLAKGVRFELPTADGAHSCALGTQVPR